MSGLYCEREQELLEAVLAGRWPDRCDEDVRRHAGTCTVCGELALVAQALQEAKDGPAARLPSAGFVWWKAQMRAKREAKEQAAQPIAVVERVASVFGLLSLLGVMIWQWPWIKGWLSWLSRIPQVDDFKLSHLWVQAPTFALLLSFGACLFLLAFILYVVLAED